MNNEDRLPRPLRGIIPPLVTSLSGPDVLDAAGLERLIEHVIAGGAAGLFLLGTTGEGPALSGSVRREVIDRACRQAALRVPVLVGITDSSLAEAAALAAFAADAGAHAVVAAGPIYFPASQAELVDYFTSLAPRSPLPLVLYNMPSLTKVRIEADTVRRLMDVPTIAGIKDTSGDMILFHHLLTLARQRADWTLLMGPEELMAEGTLLGGHGGVCGGANLRPRLFVALYHAAAAGDLAEVRRLQALVLQLGRIYRVAGGAAPYLRGLKAALALEGICGDSLAEPFRPLDDVERERVRELVAGLDKALNDELGQRSDGKREPTRAL
jgi:4-hydroxy-tetrahydrodipicolinate synthase